MTGEKLGSAEQTQTRVAQDSRVNLGRHAAQCSICNHPYRQDIEERWLEWRSADKIAVDYRVSRDSVYRHAHATGLYDKRRQNLITAAERIVERWEFTFYNGSTILGAIKLLWQMLGVGRRVEAGQEPDAKTLFRQMSKGEGEAHAQDGSVPESSSTASAATPNDSHEGEKESQVTENTRVQ